MPGTLLGHSLSHAPYIRQMADITGVAGLSLWVLMVNFICLAIWQHRTHPIRKKLLLYAVALLFFPLIYGYTRLASLPEPSHYTHVALVQPAISAINWSDPQDSGRVSQLMHLTDSLLSAAAPPPELVVWPETALALPSDTTHAGLYPNVHAWLATRSYTLLAGAILTAPKRTGPTAYTNSALLFSSTEQMQYDKKLLVPFAERVPFEEASRLLLNLRVEAGGVAGYQPGTRQDLMHVNGIERGVERGVEIGVLICFESLFGDYTRRYAKNGADFLVALSNIGWWGSRFAPAQYLAFSSLRAIETRRAFAINTVTGPGFVVNHKGETLAQSDWMQQGVLRVAIPHSTTNTFYNRTGDWVSILALLVALGLVCYMALPYISTVTGRKNT